MQASQQVSLLTCRPAPGRTAKVRAYAGVAQLVEHLFCKQVVSGSIPLASSSAVSSSFSSRSSTTVSSLSFSEGCPSGQREQAVNLPAHAYVGSNPTPSTIQNRARTARGPLPGMHSPRRGLRLSLTSAGVAQLVEPQFSKLMVDGSSICLRGSAPPQAVLGAPPQVLVPRPQNSRRKAASFTSAGVAQLVEPQFSKLMVDGSSPFSRSTFASVSVSRRDATCTPAHLAQLVEHVLGKDEVISSNLMVGSNISQP